MSLFDFGKKKRQIAEEQKADLNLGAETEDEVKAEGEAEAEEKEDSKREWDSVYMFIPVFEKKAEMPSEAEIVETLSDRLGHMEPTVDPLPEFSDENGFLIYDLWQHIALSGDGQTKHPAKIVMTTKCSPFNKNQWNDYIIGQFWSCGAERAAFAARCNYSMVCSVMLNGRLPRPRYCRMIADFADAVLDLFPDCIGIYWPGSQNLVPRAYFQELHWDQSELHFLDGGVNIRMFRFQKCEEVLYDTLGLSLIGLSDLQIYRRDFEPETAIPFLQNIVSYLFMNGNVLRDGTPLMGLHNERWLCAEGDSMAAPGRRVINLIPVIESDMKGNDEHGKEEHMGDL